MFLQFVSAAELSFQSLQFTFSWEGRKNTGGQYKGRNTWKQLGLLLPVHFTVILCQTHSNTFSRLCGKTTHNKKTNDEPHLQL